MNKEIEISPRQIAKVITDLLDEVEELQKENYKLSELWCKSVAKNKELHNKIEKLEDELFLYKQLR